MWWFSHLRIRNQFLCRCDKLMLFVTPQPIQPIQKSSTFHLLAAPNLLNTTLSLSSDCNFLPAEKVTSFFPKHLCEEITRNFPKEITRIFLPIHLWQKLHLHLAKSVICEERYQVGEAQMTCREFNSKLVLPLMHSSPSLTILS